MPNKVRMFVDPASKSTGWAVFKGKELKAHATVTAANPSGPVSLRLWDIFNGYRWAIAAEKVEEVHVENFRKNLAIQLHWSVGVIHAAAGFHEVPCVQDCWMSSWQKFCGFQKKGRIYGKLEKYAESVESEDELSAIGIGLWWVDKLRPEPKKGRSGDLREIRPRRISKRKSRKNRKRKRASS